MPKGEVMALWMVKEHRETVYVTPIEDLEKGILEVRRIGERNEPFESRPVRRGRNRIFIPLAAGCAGVELKAGRPLIFPATVSARACSLAPAQQLTDSPPSAGSAHLRGQPLIIDIGLDDKN